MRYEIDNKNAVRIFNDGEDVPFWFQPDYPNNDPFDSVAEATAWAELAVASFGTNAPYAPNGKGLAGEAKPTAEQIAAWAAKEFNDTSRDSGAEAGGVISDEQIS